MLPDLRKEYELFPPVLLAHPVGAGLRPIRSAQEEGCRCLWWPWLCGAPSCCCPMAVGGTGGAGRACKAKAAPQEQQPSRVSAPLALWAVLKRSKQSSSASPNPSSSFSTDNSRVPFELRHPESCPCRAGAAPCHDVAQPVVWTQTKASQLSLVLSIPVGLEINPYNL